MDLKKENSFDLRKYVWATDGLTFINKIKAWSEAQVLLPIAMANSCCGLEYSNYKNEYSDSLSISATESDISIKDADVLVINGVVNYKIAKKIKETYEQMSSPKWTMLIGTCAISAGPYQGYNIVKNFEDLFPVDVIVPGCPPNPLAIQEGFHKIQKLIVESYANEN
jgi:NADH-quinone oxidoreductase subunit B